MAAVTNLWWPADMVNSEIIGHIVSELIFVHFEGRKGWREINIVLMWCKIYCAWNSTSISNILKEERDGGKLKLY